MHKLLSFKLISNQAQDSSEDHAMNAQKIITRAHEKSKAIKDVRQRERENAVAELKHKKQMKKKKALAQE